MIASDQEGEDLAPDDDGLQDRVDAIEQQPLDQRAAAFAELHAELQRTLEGGDTPPRRG